MDQQPTETVIASINGDMLRTLLYMRVAELHMNELMLKSESSSIRTGIYRTLREFVELKRKILNKTDNQYPWLRKEIDKDKLWDVGALIDLMFRIGDEENNEVYDEFLSLVVNCLNSVFYLQKNRNNIWFTKYKAMFRLFIDEANADANGLPSLFTMVDGKLCMKFYKPDQPIQITI